MSAIAEKPAKAKVTLPRTLSRHGEILVFASLLVQIWESTSLQGAIEAAKEAGRYDQIKAWSGKSKQGSLQMVKQGLNCRRAKMLHRFFTTKDDDSPPIGWDYRR